METSNFLNKEKRGNGKEGQGTSKTIMKKLNEKDKEPKQVAICTF